MAFNHVAALPAKAGQWFAEEARKAGARIERRLRERRARWGGRGPGRRGGDS